MFYEYIYIIYQRAISNEWTRQSLLFETEIHRYHDNKLSHVKLASERSQLSTFEAGL